jgi:hypothetical protein
MHSFAGTGAYDAILVNVMCSGFLGSEKSRTQRRAVSSQRKRRGQPAPVRDPAGGDKRGVADCVPHLGYQRERHGFGAYMAACFEALRHNRIRPGGFCPSRLVRRSALPEHFDSRAMQDSNRVRVIARVAPEEGHGLNRRLRNRLDDAGTKKRDEKICSERFLRAGARS